MSTPDSFQEHLNRTKRMRKATATMRDELATTLPELVKELQGFDPNPPFEVDTDLVEWSNSAMVLVESLLAYATLISGYVPARTFTFVLNAKALGHGEQDDEVTQ
ncbi:MAG: hypothetical protein AAGN64_16880 [Bacteroidota bacterium]